VFGVPDGDFGQRLAALVVPKPGTSVSEADLGPFVRERLARYKVPREITFVEELPRTATGSSAAASWARWIRTEVLAPRGGLRTSG
jgi:acyl-CoA synthetase (AMP-forming)/AMP-acid ligase II